MEGLREIGMGRDLLHNLYADLIYLLSCFLCTDC